MKVTLRKFKISDLDRIMEMFPDPAVTSAIGLTLSAKPPKITRAFERKWLKKSIKEYSKKKPKSYNVAIIVDGIHVGNVGSFDYDYSNGSAEIGYWIGKDFWGKGIATAALKLFVDEIANKFKLKRIVGHAFTFNPASRKVMEKCGFQLEGIRKSVKKGKNKFYDDYQLARVK
jgi:ribosomal-protein-alanine N-acetyltransferase